MLVIEDVRDEGEMILVRARTQGQAVACPACGAETARVHGYHERMAADDPARNSDAEASREVVLVLPDNNRDPELTQVLQDAQQKYFARKRQWQHLPASGT